MTGVLLVMVLCHGDHCETIRRHVDATLMQCQMSGWAVQVEARRERPGWHLKNWHCEPMPGLGAAP